MSPSLRCWSLWRWPLVHLCSFRCRLLDGSHYTRLANVRQIKSTQTPPKPLQTLVFVGVSQPHDGDTEKRRGHHSQGDGPEPRPRREQPRRSCTATATTPRHDHHGHGRPHHHGHTHDGHARPCTTATATACTVTSHATAHTKERARAIPHDTPKHNRTNVPTLHHATNTPVGEPPPDTKSKGDRKSVV